MTYQITQLKNNQTSDLTVAVNGVKFYSWRPEIRLVFNKRRLKSFGTD